MLSGCRGDVYDFDLRCNKKRMDVIIKERENRDIEVKAGYLYFSSID